MFYCVTVQKLIIVSGNSIHNVHGCRPIIGEFAKSQQYTNVKDALHTTVVVQHFPPTITVAMALLQVEIGGNWL